MEKRDDHQAIDIDALRRDSDVVQDEVRQGLRKPHPDFDRNLRRFAFRQAWSPRRILAEFRYELPSILAFLAIIFAVYSTFRYWLMPPDSIASFRRVEKDLECRLEERGQSVVVVGGPPGHRASYICWGLKPSSP
jgi:hypothetical protein